MINTCLDKLSTAKLFIICLRKDSRYFKRQFPFKIKLNEKSRPRHLLTHCINFIFVQKKNEKKVSLTFLYSLIKFCITMVLNNLSFNTKFKRYRHVECYNPALVITQDMQIFTMKFLRHATWGIKSSFSLIYSARIIISLLHHKTISISDDLYLESFSYMYVW